MGIMSPIAGRIFDKVGGRLLGIIGSMLLVGGLVRFAGISATTGYLTLMIAFAFMMLGMSLIMMPVMTAGLNFLPPELYPHGTAMSNTLQQVAGAVGTALLVTIMSEGTRAKLRTDHPLKGHPSLMAPIVRLATIHGMDWAFTAATVFAVLALGLCFFVRRPVALAAAG
jgi:MFS family permease